MENVIDNTSNTPAGGETPAPTTPDSAISGQPALQVATQPAPGAAPTQPQVEPSWLKGRLEETRAAAERRAAAQWQSQEAQYKSQLEAVQRQLHALVGVTPQENPQVSAVKQQFQQLFPELAQLAERAQDLLSIVDRSSELEVSSKHYWSEYGRQRMESIYSRVGDALGQPLSDAGKRVLHNAFSGWVASSPELSARYTQDPSMVDEFVQDYIATFIDPVRRGATAQVQQQVGQPRTFPQDAPSGVPQVTPTPQPRSLDDRAANAWTLYQTQRRQG